MKKVIINRDYDVVRTKAMIDKQHNWTQSGMIKYNSAQDVFYCYMTKESYRSCVHLFKKNEPKIKEKRICKYCEQEFYAVRDTKMFCNSKCKDAWWRIERRPVKKIGSGNTKRKARLN